jgi:hypothetical protein
MVEQWLAACNDYLWQNATFIPEPVLRLAVKPESGQIA